MTHARLWVALALVGSAIAPACGGDDESDPTPGGGSGGGAGDAAAGGGTAGGGGSAGSAGSGGKSSLASALEAQGFQLQKGSFRVLDLSDCCAAGKSCSGNNPTSPYGAFHVPRAPGQTAGNPNEDGDGMAASYRLRADEAVIWVGTTPPVAKYFGFTPYLMDREDSPGVRKPIFASLSETLNQLVVQVGSEPDPFEAPTAIIATADQITEGDAKKALIAGGVAAGAINTVTFDPVLVKLGIDASADTVGVLFRVALFDDAAKGKAYLDAIPGELWRATPKTPTTPSPLPAPAARPKNTTDTETTLSSALDALEAAVIAKHPGLTAKSLFVNQGTPDPLACIQGKAFCAGDNRDTNYPTTLPQPLFSSPDDFFWVIGVNHAVTGKTSYSNFSVYAIEHLVGVASVDNLKYAGSASAFLPSHPDAPKLYAWKVARSCGSEPNCLAIPDAGCPTGVGAGKAGTITFRTYLEPKTKTAPDPSTLLQSRVIRFTKP